MDRKKFLKRTLAAGIVAVASPSLINASSNGNSDRIKDKENVGFNHLPNKEIKTMNTVLHKANTRGFADHGWLKANHSFSFANYYNPERMQFGVLRVLNDDSIAPSKGFGTHPHDNMEIITIPFEGGLKHKDSMGNSSVINAGDIQVMSAGTGIQHSEFNAYDNSFVKLLQIWVFPNKQSVEPRYDQIKLDVSKMKNNFLQILSPNPNDEGVWIHQNAWFHLGEFDANLETTYKFKDDTNGVYAFILEGEAIIDKQTVSKRDAMGIWDVNEVEIKFQKNTKILLLEVPLTV